MKRNSKRFMALFLSLAMSITPAMLIQAEEATDIKSSSASDQDVLSEAELIPTVTAAPTEAPSEDIPKTSDQEEENQTPAAEEPELSVTPSPSLSPAPVSDTEETAASDETEEIISPNVKPDGSDIVIDKPDDTGSLEDFKITSSSAKLIDDKIQVTLVTSADTYDALYLGGKDDAISDPENVCVGTPTDGGYTFILEVPASETDQKYQIAIRNKKSGQWEQYVEGGEYTITIPGMKKEDIVPAPTATPTPAPAEGTCANGVYNVTVNSSATMFRVVDCVLTSKNGKMTAVLTLSGTGYDYLCLGTKEEAAKADPSTWVPYVVNSEGKYTYEIPVESLDKGIAVAAFSHKNQIWYDRILTFQSNTLNKTADIPEDAPQPDATITPVPGTDTVATPTPTPAGKPQTTATPTPTPATKPDKTPDKESKYESDLSGGTAAVNSSTTLKDGTYTPDSFSWSGGTGKVNISCSKITVTGGQAYATIVFSSEYYGYVKANGNTYYGNCGGGTSTFTIPVALNQNNSIIGMTTRMSQAHEITYTIYVALKGANDPKKTDKENPSGDNSMLSTGNKKLDDTAPEITGLEYKDETKLEHAKYFKIYNYDKGITLLEVDMTTDTARKKETVSDTKEATDMISKTEDLYMGNVVKYLIVPEDTVIPAGLDKDVILVQQPVENAYAASDNSLSLMAELNLSDKIACSAKEEDDSLIFAGTYEDTDFKALVKNQCQIAILPSDVLPDAEDEVEEKEALLKDSAGKYAALKIPFIVDRSDYEKNDAAKEEWKKVFEAIFE